jgi:hypothetical protein
LPKDYRVKKEVFDAIKESSRLYDDTDSANYILFYYTSSYHIPANNEEFLGLITNKEQEPFLVNKKKAMTYKARELNYYYSLLNADMYYSHYFLPENEPSFVRRFLRRELQFYVVDENEYYNSNIIKLYDYDYRYISVKQ